MGVSKINGDGADDDGVSKIDGDGAADVNEEFEKLSPGTLQKCFKEAKQSLGMALEREHERRLSNCDTKTNKRTREKGGTPDKKKKKKKKGGPPKKKKKKKKKKS